MSAVKWGKSPRSHHSILQFVINEFQRLSDNINTYTEVIDMTIALVERVVIKGIKLNFFKLSLEFTITYLF